MEEPEITLDDMCELIVDCEHKTAPSQDTGYPSIRTPNIGRGRLILEGVNRVSEEVYHQWTQRAVPQTDDLILAREAPVGNVAVIPANLRVCLGQRTVLIRPDKTKANPHYLLYLLLGKGIQDRIQSLTAGATVPHLNMSDIRTLKLPKIPDRDIQDRIASILFNYDELIENNNKRIQLLEQISRTIYEEWFIRFRFPGHDKARFVDSVLGRIPEGWEVTTMGDIAELTMGLSPKGTTYNTDGIGMPLLNGARDFRNGKIIPAKFTTDPKRVCEPGDILFCIRATIGNIVFADREYCLGRGVTALRANNETMREMIFYMLDEHLEEFEKVAGGAVIRGLTRDDINDVPIVVPETRSLTHFHSIADAIFKQESIIQQENEILSRSRDFLLPWLISGKVDVSSLDIRIMEEAS